MGGEGGIQTFKGIIFRSFCILYFGGFSFCVSLFLGTNLENFVCILYKNYWKM